MAIIYGLFAGIYFGIVRTRGARGWIELVVFTVLVGLAVAIWGLFRGKDEGTKQTDRKLAAMGIDPITRVQLFFFRFIWTIIACFASSTVTYGIRLWLT